MDKKFRLRQVITDAGEDRVVTPELRVVNKIVYLDIDTHFKHQDGNWYQNCDGVWVNLMGGIPDYAVDTMLDEILFEGEE